MKKHIQINDPKTAMFHNIIGMGLGFSAMMRLFEEKTKVALREKMIKEVRRLLSVKSEEEFRDGHARFCRWGMDNISTAEKTLKNGRIKPSGRASYGQMAKTLNVVLKVVVHYCRLPNRRRAALIDKWLDSAVDTKMMAYIRPNIRHRDFQWPKTIEQVGEDEYKMIQDAVYVFIEDQHNGMISTMEFDDIYWEALNKK